VKEPLLRDRAFLQDVKASRSVQRLNIWWLGQSGFLVQYDDAHLLLDPYLSDSLTRKYANSAKPHVRMTAPVVAPEQLDFIDVVTSTHNHTDHLDAETLTPLLAVNPTLTVIVPRANLAFAAARLEIAPARLTPISVSEVVTIGPFRLRAIPAAHETLETDAAGDHKTIGYIVEVGGFTLYHSGDTVLYEGMSDYLTQPLDVAFLPINGRDPGRGVAGNLSAREAVQLAQALQARLVIPCHFDMFEFNTVSPAEFVTLAEAANQSYALLQNGQRLSLTRPA
jgi:L-ascorbate metabolism protein UlaG (beta-lactamase superfamily)